MDIFDHEKMNNLEGEVIFKILYKNYEMALKVQICFFHISSEIKCLNLKIG